MQGTLSRRGGAFPPLGEIMYNSRFSRAVIQRRHCQPEGRAERPTNCGRRADGKREGATRERRWRKAIKQTRSASRAGRPSGRRAALPSGLD